MLHGRSVWLDPGVRSPRFTGHGREGTRGLPGFAEIESDLEARIALREQSADHRPGTVECEALEVAEVAFVAGEPLRTRNDRGIRSRGVAHTIAIAVVDRLPGGVGDNLGPAAPSRGLLREEAL